MISLVILGAYVLFALAIGDASPMLLAITAAVTLVCAIAAHRGLKDAEVVGIVALMALVGWGYSYGNVASVNMLMAGTVFVIPAIIALGAALSDTPRAMPQWGDVRSWTVPLLYFVLIGVTIFVLTQNDLYTTYFDGPAYASMQVLLLIATGTLFFVPLYERYGLD
jgi:hypothetical protein